MDLAAPAKGLGRLLLTGHSAKVAAGVAAMVVFGVLTRGAVASGDAQPLGTGGPGAGPARTDFGGLALAVDAKAAGPMDAAAERLPAELPSTTTATGDTDPNDLAAAATASAGQSTTAGAVDAAGNGSSPDAAVADGAADAFRVGSVGAAAYELVRPPGSGGAGIRRPGIRRPGSGGSDSGGAGGAASGAGGSGSDTSGSGAGAPPGGAGNSGDSGGSGFPVSGSAAPDTLASGPGLAAPGGPGAAAPAPGSPTSDPADADCLIWQAESPDWSGTRCQVRTTGASSDRSGSARAPVSRGGRASSSDG